MRYLLDSDTLSNFFEELAESHESIATKIAALGELDEVCISILTIFEHEYGWAKAPEAKKIEIRNAIDTARAEMEILPLSIEAARVYGQLKVLLVETRGLDKKKSRSHNIDLLIAATAITEQCVLVSSDAVYKQLRKLNSTLTVEDWASDEHLTSGS